MTRRRLAVLVVAAVVVVAIAIVLRGRHERQPEPPVATSASTSSLLVLTWAPSLCKVERSAGGCRTGRVSGLGNSFVLHGLWPQPRDQQYCDIPKKERDRRPVDLPADLQNRLRDMMSDSTYMTRHEWSAHGTCSGVSPAEYFGIATTLADQAIEVLDPVFDRAAGGQLTARSVRDAVEARLGKGAGSRVGLVCRDARGEGSVAYEVRLSLPPVVQLRPDTPVLGDALARGPTVPPGCGTARVP